MQVSERVITGPSVCVVQAVLHCILDRCKQFLDVLWNQKADTHTMFLCSPQSQSDFANLEMGRPVLIGPNPSTTSLLKNAHTRKNILGLQGNTVCANVIYIQSTATHAVKLRGCVDCARSVWK